MARLFRIRSRSEPNLFCNERGILLISVAMVFIVAAGFVAVAATRTTKDKIATDTRLENVASLYAAQAGEQAMLAAIQQDALTRFAAFQNSWAGTGAILTNPATFFSSQVTIPGVQLPNGRCFDTVTANLAFVNAQITPIRQVYNFQYTINSQGTDPNDADRLANVVTNGNFQIQVDRQSFANYALFTNTHTITSGTRVWFTSSTNFTGRVHTNDRFAFAYSPTFSNGVTSSVAGDAYYYNDGNPLLLAADHNAPRDTPVFGEGFQRGASPIMLPANAFDQREAAAGGEINDNSDLRNLLGLPPDTSPPPDGIYVPNDGASVTGGVYVEGNVSNMLMYVDGSNRQAYQITHANGTNSTIIIDHDSNHTIINSVPYSGTPNGAIYVAGNIYSLGGPSRSGGTRPPAVQSDTATSVFAEGDIIITRDIVYQDDPSSATDATNVLGMFTPGGDIRIGTSAPDDITIHSTLMTSDSSGVVQVDDYDEGDPRGTATILGGVISSYYGAFGTFNKYGHQSGFARNFQYDQRLNGGLAPPYFPTTSIFMPATSNVNPVTYLSQRQYLPGNSDNFQTPSSNPNINPNFAPGV